MSSPQNPLRKIIGPFILALLLFPFHQSPGYAADNEETEKTIYGQAFNETKEYFDTAKEKFDAVEGTLSDFKDAVETWRNATTKETQESGKEGIDNLMNGLNETALNSLIEKMFGEEAVKKLDKLEKATGIKLSDRINLWEMYKGSRAQKEKQMKNAFGYMYDMSSIERYLREKGVFDRLDKAKKIFKMGEEKLKAAGDMVEFVKLFDPNSVNENDPTGSLKKMKEVLEYSKKFTDKIPALGHLIDFYAQATDAFIGALDRLDKKLKEARQGALCGQFGVDKAVQTAFERSCPGCDCLTYLSISQEYPRISPIRGWQGVESRDVFLFFDDTHHILLKGNTFPILYDYYSALKTSRFESNRGLVSPEILISQAMAIVGGISEHDTKFRKYYDTLEGSNGPNIRKVLEAAGVLKDFRIVSSEGKGEYALGSTQEKEFRALCFFSHGFRQKVEELIKKYGKHINVHGDVEAKDKNAEITKIELWIDHEVVKTIECKGSKCTYTHYVEKDWEFKIWVHAKGFKDVNKRHKVSSELANTIATIYLESLNCKDLLDLCNDFKRKKEDVETKVNDAYKSNTTEQLKGDLEDFRTRATPVITELLGYSAEFSARPTLLEAYTKLNGSLKTMDDAINGTGKGLTSLDESIKAYLDYLKVQGDECLTDCICDENSKGDESGKRETDITKAYEKVKDCINKQHTLNAYIDDIIEFLKRRAKLIDTFRKAKADGEAALANAKDLLIGKKDQTPKPDTGKTDDKGKVDDGKPIQTTPDTKTQDIGKPDSKGTIPVGTSNVPPTGTTQPVGTPPASPLPGTPPSGSVPPGTTPPGSSPSGQPPASTPQDKTAPTVPISDVKKNPKQLAAEKYQWIKESLDYYKKLWDLEDKAFRALEKSARSNALQKPCPAPQPGDSMRLAALEKEMQEMGVQIYWGRIRDPLTGEEVMGRIMKQGKPYSSAVTNEWAAIKMRTDYDFCVTHYEFECMGSQLDDHMKRRREIKAKIAVIEDSKVYKNFQEYDVFNDHGGYLKAIETIRKELNIPDPIQSPVTLPWSYASICGASTKDVSGERLLRVKLEAFKTKLKVGEISDVTAHVEGGRPEYRYFWIGNHSGKGSVVQFSSSTTGAQTLSLTVTDSTGTAASDSLTFEVGSPAGDADAAVKPKLSLTINNDQPYVGETVVVTVHEEPAMDDKDISFWWEYSGNVDNPGPEPNIPNTRAYSYKPKDTKPVSVIVHGKTGDNKDDLTAKMSISARNYDIKVAGPKAAGPKPMIWKCDTQLGGDCPGLVEVDKEIAVFQRVEFSAEVLPMPDTDLRYAWKVSGSSCSLANPGSRDVGVTCSETGSYAMEVTVRNKDNIELGKGTGSLSVTISQKDLDTAQAKSKPKVSLKTEKSTFTIGDVVSATATVDGGKPSYSYRWTGDHEGQGLTVRLSPKKPGEQTLSVEVTDAKGNRGSASITFTVEAIKLIIEGLQNEVVFGTKLDLSVKPDIHQIAWKAEPAVSFTPQKSPGGRTNAAFERIGRITVWAEALQQTGETIGESERKEVNVVAPKFMLRFDPPKGKAGDEVKAVIESGLRTDKTLLTFVWMTPQPSQVKTYEPNIIGFTPRKNGPVEFYAIAKTITGNQNLAEIRSTYEVEAVALDVSLAAEPSVLKVGDSATITAATAGGKPPYTVTWSGAATGAGENILFKAQQKGTSSIHAEVQDSVGNRGSADIALNVEEPVPLAVSLTADRTILKVGDSAFLASRVTGGKPPYAITWSGSATGDGTSITFRAQIPGTNTIHAKVQDSAGNRGSADIALKVTEPEKPKVPPVSDLNVTPPQQPVAAGIPKEEPKIYVSLRADKYRLNIDEKTYVYIDVQNFKPPYTLKWGGYAQGLGDQGGKVPFVGAPAPGTYTVTADVTDAAGKRAIGSIELIVVGDTSPKPPVKTTPPPSPQPPAPPVYDPTKDPGATKSSGMNIDITQVDQLGSQFQGETKGTKPGSQKVNPPQAPVQQSDTYTNIAKKPPETPAAQNPPAQPYPPGYPPVPPQSYPPANTQGYRPPVQQGYPPVSSSNTQKDWKDTKKSSGEKGSSSSTSAYSPPAAQCDAAQKQAAYQEGYKCGQNARQNSNKMTSACMTTSQGHMNRDTKMGWGSCLYSGFDEGYRAGLGTTSSSVSPSAVIAALENRSSQNVHIFVEGQDNFGPQNKLAPGENKKVSIKVPKGGGVVKFMAGRIGQKLAECSWDYTPDSSTRVPVVKFSDPKNLSCTTGSR